MNTFHLYVFHRENAISQDRNEVRICRLPVFDPNSYSPGFVTHHPIQAKNLHAAKLAAREYAPVVIDPNGKVVR